MDRYEVLKKYFGYEAFRKGQEFLIDALLKGRDVLGIMPTGAGKSICYQVPALLMPGVTVVVSPLISLMKDQVAALNQAGVHAAYINSSLSETQIKKALQLAAGGQYKIVYVAPERLLTFDFMQFARLAEISMVTVDEAHCISQWGQDFRPGYRKIADFVRSLPKRPVIGAFTATATEIVREDIAEALGLSDPQILVTGFDRKNLCFSVETPKKKDGWVLQYVRGHASESGVIYCATRKNVETVYRLLSENDIPVTKYHAGLANGERKQNQEDFIYDRKPVMVATNAFGMGIDKSNVRYVIHYNMPQSMENYYQEAGRAGRDGEPAACILLYSAQDLVIGRFLLEGKEQSPELTGEEAQALRRQDEERLRGMDMYCTTTDCLRQYILRYFGEEAKDRCENCSNCLAAFEELDVTEEAKQVIACVEELKGRYGINVVVGTLLGENRAKLREYGVSEYPSYGKLKGRSQPEVKEIIRRMTEEELLTVSGDKYGLLGTAPKARAVLDGDKTVCIRRRTDRTDESFGESRSAGKNRRPELLNSRGLELFELLRRLRAKIAREESVPPYLIFSDRTLTDLCVKLPFTGEEMLQVSGVGESKLAKYGERFLKTVRSFAKGEREKLYFGEEAPAAGLREKALEKPSGERKKGGKGAFYITPQQAKTFSYCEKYLIPELAAVLSEFRDPETMKKLSGAEIFRWLQQEGYVEQKRVSGRWQKLVSEKGRAAGLFLAARTGKNGTEYEDIYCGEQAQRMIAGRYVRTKD